MGYHSAIKNENFNTLFSFFCRLWQNFKELCPQTYQCNSIHLPNPLVNGEAHQNGETCTTYSCSCSGTERKRGSYKTREGCELMISVNKARCTWDRRRCRNVSNDRCGQPDLRDRFNMQKECPKPVSCTL